MSRLLFTENQDLALLKVISLGQAFTLKSFIEIGLHLSLYLNAFYNFMWFLYKINIKFMS